MLILLYTESHRILHRFLRCAELSALRMCNEDFHKKGGGGVDSFFPPLIGKFAPLKFPLFSTYRSKIRSYGSIFPTFPLLSPDGVDNSENRGKIRIRICIHLPGQPKHAG